jgi:hypothetical protein
MYIIKVAVLRQLLPVTADYRLLLSYQLLVLTTKYHESLQWIIASTVERCSYRGFRVSANQMATLYIYHSAAIETDSLLYRSSTYVLALVTVDYTFSLPAF